MQIFVELVILLFVFYLTLWCWNSTVFIVQVIRTIAAYLCISSLTLPLHFLSRFLSHFLTLFLDFTELMSTSARQLQLYHHHNYE